MGAGNCRGVSKGGSNEQKGLWERGESAEEALGRSAVVEQVFCFWMNLEVGNCPSFATGEWHHFSQSPFTGTRTSAIL